MRSVIPTRQLVINGRFLAQRMTGVQRFAMEITRALDARVARHGPAPFAQVCLVRPDNAPELVGLKHVVQQTRGRGSGHLWEQAVLANVARGAFLLSLGPTGPLVHTRQVLTIHDAGVYARPTNYRPTFRLAYQLLLPLLARRALQVVTVSEFSASELSSALNTERSKFVVVANSAEHMRRVVPDNTLIRRLGLTTGRFVLAVGTLNPNKNVATVVSAFQRVRRTDLQLVVVGGRADRIFPSVDLSRQRITTAGAVSDAELRSLYAHALCLAFPSYYEGFGIPPIEAMLHDCPVIVSNTSSLPEVCGDAALYTEPDDDVTLAAHVDALADSPQLRHELVERGRARVARYSWAASADELWRHLADLCEAPRGRS